MTVQQSLVLEEYIRQISAQKEEIRKLKSNINRLSFLRLGIFLVGVAVVFLVGKWGAAFMMLAGFVTLVIFVLLVARQAKAQEHLDFSENLLKVLENEIAQFSSGANVYDNGSSFADATHPYTDDLDVFGKGSVFHFVNRCNTQKGKVFLASWFKAAASLPEIASRQAAVKELKEHIVFSFNFRAYLLPFRGFELDELATALQSDLKSRLAFTSGKRLIIYVRIIPFILLMLTAGAYFYNALWSLFALVLIGNFFLTGLYARQINQVYNGFDQSARKLSAYSKVLKWIENEPWKASHLQKLVQLCRDEQGGLRAHQKIEALAKILRGFDYRLNFIVGPLLNFFLLWDIRCAMKLADWHQKSSGLILASFDVIGETEALISLSTLHYNHTAWPFPVIEPSFYLKASAIGHPLITESIRVDNDFSFNHHKTVDIITGSNMAGKSTFLRTLGVSMMLAYAGAPVCARELRLSVMTLVSYMRIKDSLNESTSTFKAELDRLKMILEVTAKKSDALVLIDEMLRGTNSKDKYTGSKAFIEKLISQKTAALVATHDLQIADLAEVHLNLVRNFHFDIQMEEQNMFFDYKIKDGECQTFNALLLLKAIGLEVPDK
ncbi:MAG: MutS-related protein [Sphingobacteriaceae bacterium]